MKELPVDVFQRHMIVREIVDQVRWKPKLRILDVGGASGATSKFLHDDDILVLDLRLDRACQMVRGDAVNLPFHSESFDIVLTIDAVEHLPNSSRTPFIEEMIRVSKEYVILAAPFDTRGVRDAEEFVYNFAKRTLNLENQFLAEHIKYGIPNLEETVSRFSERGLDCRVIPNGYLFNWTQMLLIEQFPTYNESEELHKQANRFYNEYFYESDNREPSYRKVVVARKKGPVQLLDDFPKMKSAQEQPSPMPLLSQVLSSLPYTDHMRKLVKSRDQAISWLWQTLDSKETRYAQIIHEYDVALTNIKRSFGYKCMRLYSSRIDKLFPDRTRRGEFRKVVTGSILAVTNQGVRRYFSQVTEKIKHREFTVVQPTELGTQPAPMQETTIAHEFSDEMLNRQLQEFLSTENSQLELPSTKNPKVSILIPTYNKAAYTHKCLQTLRTNTDSQFEVIIVDNNSTDETGKLLDRVRNARIIRNKENRFFAPACNQAAKAAQAKYLLLLNNDAFVLAACVSSLVKALEYSPDIGAVGTKLIGRDGRLLEAGSIIWADGNTVGYGRGEDPTKSEYNFLRDVDYCSGACLLVLRDLFEKLGGLDESFPMYYEEADLCVRIWRNGFRVLYQPLAAAVHAEFGSSSFDNVKNWMEQNRVRFVAKHSEFLSTQLSSSQSNVLRASNRRSGPSMLIIDDCVPKPADGGGFPRMFLMLETLARLGYKITFLPLSDLTPKQPETEILTQSGVEILWGVSNPVELLRDRSSTFEIALISRPHNALAAAGAIRATNPNIPVVYDVEALWHKREQLRAMLGTPSRDLRFTSEQAELSLINTADDVISVSMHEKEFIESKLPEKKGRVLLWGFPIPTAPTHKRFEDRSGLLFVGGFKSSPAHNDDAAIHLVNDLLPRIRLQKADCGLTIAASNAPDSVKNLQSDFVTVTESYVKYVDELSGRYGDLKDLRELYDSRRVFVAPIRFGAGIMLKVVEAMAAGLPCVVSAIGAHGLGLTDGREALVAKSDDEFVEKTVRLYSDPQLWNSIRKCGLEFVEKNFSPANMEKKLDDFFKSILEGWKIGLTSNFRGGRKVSDA